MKKTFITYASKYDMPYHELESVVAFILNFEQEDIPESIKEYMDKWQDFLAENL